MQRDPEQKSGAGSLRSTFLGYFKGRRETVGNSLHLTAGQVNARPLVQPADQLPDPNFIGIQGGQGPGLAPDPIRYGNFDGIGRIGIARIPKFVSVYDQTAWESQTFIAGKVHRDAGASMIRGRQRPEFERANIRVPNSTSYGAQFEYQPDPYGYI